MNKRWNKITGLFLLTLALPLVSMKVFVPFEERAGNSDIVATCEVILSNTWIEKKEMEPDCFIDDRVVQSQYLIDSVLFNRDSDTAMHAGQLIEFVGRYMVVSAPAGCYSVRENDKFPEVKTGEKGILLLKKNGRAYEINYSELNLIYLPGTIAYNTIRAWAKRPQ